MQFIDLKKQYHLIRENINKRICRVLEHGCFIMGPEVQELEIKLAEYVGVKHCIGVSSGTDALLIAMMALGVGRGDEVITTPFSFIATAETISLLGAIPVFSDVDPLTLNINPDLIEKAITPKTKAIIPVSLYGQCADFDEINKIAEQYDIPVIEDAAQSFGASYKGKMSCGLSTIGCTSFFPSKPLGAYGDGGACFTDDEDVAQVIRQIRVHGQEKRYHHCRIGINGRLDTIQAAVLLEKMDIFPREVAARAFFGQRYTDLLKDSGVVTPHIKEGNYTVYAQYTIQSDERELLRKKLEIDSIPTAVHYPLPLNLQPSITGTGKFPESEAAAKKVLSLPMHPYLTEYEQDRVIASILR